jgi:hypothetical protein
VPARGKIRNRFIFDFGLVIGSHLSVTNYARGLRDELMDGELRAQVIGKFGSKFDGGQESKGYNPKSHCMGLYGSQWQFCEYMEDQQLFISLSSFTIYFVTSFGFLNLN